MEPALRYDALQGAAPDALRPLVMEHRRLVLRFMQGRVRDAHAAEDLTQETLVRGMQYARGLREASCIGAWLLRIAYHVALDWHRRRLRRRDEPEGDEILERTEQVGEPAPVELDEERCARERWRRQLRRALAHLPGLDRVLVIGHYFVGLSCKELAARSGISRDNVKVRLCRARRRLRGLMPAALDPGRNGPRIVAVRSTLIARGSLSSPAFDGAARVQEPPSCDHPSGERR